MKDFVLRLVAGANVAVILGMLAVGYSDRINPAEHPLAASAGLLFPAFLAANVALLMFWLVVRKLWAAIPVAGLILAYQPVRTYAPLNVPREAPEGALKVMSYNVYGFATWTDPSQPSEILAYIARQRPDILCLEEMGGGARQRAIADSTLRAMYPHADTARAKGGGDETGLYSRFPILRKQRIAYESKTNHSAAFWLLTGPRDTTIVVVCHLETTGLSPEDRTQFHRMMKGDVPRDDVPRESRVLWHKLGQSAAIRAPQADSVAAFVRRHQGQSIILAGDFNDSPISYARRRLASVLGDCYTATANGPGISYHYNNFYVRIDNIMCSEHWTPYACRVDNTIKASDHYPILCSLVRGGTRPGQSANPKNDN